MSKSEEDTHSVVQFSDSGGHVRLRSLNHSKTKFKKRLSNKALSYATFSFPSPRGAQTDSSLDLTESIIVSPRKKSNLPFFYFPEIHGSSSYSMDKPRALETKLHTIVVLGCTGSGKTDFIHKVMNHDEIAIPKKNTPNSHCGIGRIEEGGEEILFTMEEYNNMLEVKEIARARALDEVSFIVLFDHTQFESIHETKIMIENITKSSRKNKQAHDASILLVLSKIDRLAGSTKMEEIFSSVISIAKMYECKLLPITVTMNKTNILASVRASLLSHRERVAYPCSSIESIYYSLRHSNTSYIFDDGLMSTIEDYLWIQGNEESWKEAYCVVKGEFLILQLDTEIIVVFLTVCETKYVQAPTDGVVNNTMALQIKTPGGNTYLLTANSEEKTRAWANVCEVSLSGSVFDTMESLREKKSDINNDISFSGILNISNRIACVDCGSRVGCPFVSRQFCIYLCGPCANAHIQVLEKSLSKILTAEEVLNFPTIWPALHEHCNDHFNILWEYSKPDGVRLAERSSSEDRVKFVRAKYKSRAYYGCYKYPLYAVVSPESLKWKQKYLFISHHGILNISDDEVGSVNEVTAHISYCTFTGGSDLGLSLNHFRIIGPGMKFILRADDEDIAQRWLAILHSSFQRVKYTQLSSMNPTLSLPRIRKRRSEGLRYNMADVCSLLEEKHKLQTILKLRKKQEALKEKYERKLNDALKEIQALKKLETDTLIKISSLEPITVRCDVSSLGELLSEALRRQTFIEPGKPYCSNPVQKNHASKISAKRKNLLKTLEQGVLILNDDNVVRGGSINKLLDLLVSPMYCEESYESLLLNTFPTFADPLAFLGTLEQIFALPVRDKLESVNYLLEDKNQGKLNPKNVNMSLEKTNFQETTRNNVLLVISRWMDEFWESDFHNSQMVIAKLISFLDYIVSSIPMFKKKASNLRLKISTKFEASLRHPEYTMGDATIGKLSSLPRGGITSLSNCIEVLTDVEILDVAKQLCLIDHGLVSRVHIRELLDKLWTTIDREELSPNVVIVTERFNKLTQWVGTCIVQCDKKRQRIKTLEWFILLAQRCFELFNYHALIAILGGIQDPSVSRMKKTWDGVSPRIRAVFEEVKAVMKLNDNWSSYRQCVAQNIAKKQSFVPYIGIYLKDLLVIEDGFSDLLEVQGECRVINIEKRRKMSLIINELKQVKAVPYNFQRIGVVISSLELGLSMFPLLDAANRFEQSKKIEPRL